MLVVEGSVANEKIKSEGYWTGFRQRSATGQPIHLAVAGRLAPKAWRSSPRHLRHLRRHPRHARQSHRRDGGARLSRAGTGSPRPALPIVCVPGCPVQPDNLSETILYLLYQAAGSAPMIPLDESCGRPGSSADRPRWLRPRWLLRRGRLRDEYGSPECLVKLGCWGPVVNATSPSAAGWTGSAGARTWRHLHRVHDAGIPRQVHAVHGRAAGEQVLHPRRAFYGQMIEGLPLHHQHTLTRNRSGETRAPSSRPATRTTWRLREKAR